MSIREVVVVVPARDEVDRIDACLDGIRAARAALDAVGVASRCIVVADACTDGTAERAAARGDVAVLRIDAAAVGAARRAGADAIATEAPGRTWMACTDADSVVPADWLTTHVALADAGADAVLGLVHLDPAEAGPERVVRWLAAEPGGERIHGTNLGVRLDAYAHAGGFAELPMHEDVELVGALRATGSRVVATPLASVRTSARTHGRAPDGFAAHLRALVAGG